MCILPLLENGDVLLERQFRYAMGEVLTEIPAGKLDYIGEDPREAALPSWFGILLAASLAQP